MLASRSIPRVPALAALAAGACLFLGACGGSSSPSAGPSSSPTGFGSGSPIATHKATPSKGLLTGHFCKDLVNLGKVANLSAAETKKIGQDRSAAVTYLEQAAANFEALGKEGGSQVHSFMHVLAGQYETLASSAASGSSLSKMQQQAAGVETQGASGQAFRKLVKYVRTNCSSAA
jgi:hypothetical protein